MGLWECARVYVMHGGENMKEGQGEEELLEMSWRRGDSHLEQPQSSACGKNWV